MPALPLHPLAELFPAMDPDEYEAFKADVAEHGLREPVWAWNGQVIDGRHRQRACEELAVPCMYRQWSGDEAGLVAFVVSLNMRRRHLSTSQRAMIAAELANMRQGERTDQEPSANLRKVSQTEAAQQLNVSERSVTTAVRVKQQAVPEVVAAVRDGEVSVSAAAAMACKPADEQRAELEARRRPEPRVVRDIKFDAHRERLKVVDWLAGARRAWPEEYRGAFVKMVRLILTEMESDDADD